ncbi:MAG: MarR family transcriptional regulator [Ruminococcus sp.]|nr:MarR family transcriptional regulator [Ruminococcus sp.]
MNPLNEDLLQAWLGVSMAINNDRISLDLPYNESLICHLLYRRHLQHGERPLTATDLCRMTRMQKSQMNRTLTGMEEKGLVSRERSASDKRQIHVMLRLEQLDAYEKQHKKILGIIDELVTIMGKEKAEEALAIFRLIADAARKVIE